MVQAFAPCADHFRRYSESRHSLAPQYLTQWVGKRSSGAERRNLRMRTSIEPASRRGGVPLLRVGHLEEHHDGSLSAHLSGFYGNLLAREERSTAFRSAPTMGWGFWCSGLPVCQGYDFALGGSGGGLAGEPLHRTPEQIWWLAVARYPPCRGRCLLCLCDFRSGQSARP